MICAAVFVPTWAQAPLRVGNHHTVHISSSGPSDIEPTVTPTGLQWEIRHPDATYMAIHFASFDLARGDYLVVSDADGGQMYKLQGRGKMEAGTFWSRHVKGDTVLLELLVADQQAGGGFVIDEYVAGFADLGPPATKAICGVDDKENAVCYAATHPDEYDRGRAVARLLINGSGLCTGWLVSSDDHLMTNEHCVTSASDALNTDYEFMAEAANCGDSNCQLCHPGTVFSGATFIQDSSNLDYCLVRINSGNPASTYGYLELDDRVAVPGEELYILQHPGGRAKEFGIYSTHSSDTGGICRVYSTSEPPCSGAGYSDVGYYCDTEGGSSGSPVLARSSHRVIALHHCANCPNRGVPINLIYPEISDFIISSGLKVTPGGSFVSEGDAGGPFTPDSKIYTLENLNDTGIDYTVSKGEDWVTLSDTGGHLNGHAMTDVTVSINSNANGLAEGMYIDTVDFVNTTDHDGDTSRDVQLTVGIPDIVYEWTLDTDPGWTTDEGWAFGVPLGGGGSYGNSDPTSGYTGSNVYGYNLAGDYTNYLPERHLTTTAIDCALLSSVTLRFQRWLGVETSTYDHAYVRVSNDGVNWTTVWENGGSFSDPDWTLQEYDISAVADHQPTVYLRWTMGSTDGSVVYCGWNIDDIQILALGGEPECFSDPECDDGSVCTVDTCVSGHCQNTPISCDDADPCTVDDCDPVTGCFNDPIVCEPGFVCSGGVCVPVECDYDGVCETGEDCLTCSDDCISGVGGDCGNGYCEPSIGEDCISCPADCAGKQGGKPSTRYCCGDGDGINPVGCGDLRCTSQGYSCSDDPAGSYCCGDLFCEGMEDQYNCAVDCGAPPDCGNATCDVGEDQCSCPEDCGNPPSTETSCSDDFDNDCDGFTDCDDSDCQGDAACPTCLVRGEACTLDSECCSNWCHRGNCK
jgi:hypothetical protein